MNTMQSRSRLFMSAGEFFEKTRPSTIEAFLQTLARKSSKEEVAEQTGIQGSWRFSLPVIAAQLHQAGLSEPFVSIEFRAPHGRAEADVVIVGKKDECTSVLVVELKQWSTGTWNAETSRVENIQAKYDSVEHPVIQAKGYADMINHYISGFSTESGALVDYCALLHNASKDAVSTLFSLHSKYTDKLFLNPELEPNRFQKFLIDHFDNVNGASINNELNFGKEKMSKDLLESAAEMYSNPEAFPLSAEQREVVSSIQAEIQQAISPRAIKDRSIIIVKGKPGSGKTFICVQLMARLAKTGNAVQLLTNSTSLRASLEKAAGVSPESRHLKAMIGRPGSFWDLDKTANSKTALIIDEAQRLLEYSPGPNRHLSNKRKAKLHEGGITQLFEVVKSCKVTVLMMDDLQQTTATDFLTTEKVAETAKQLGVDLKVIELTEQHRNGGSKIFEEWVDSLVDNVPVPWTDEENFFVKVADSPEHMEEILRSHQKEQPRILAGFCWPWTQYGNARIRATKNRPGEKWVFKSYEDVPNDIKIGNWKRKWNLSKRIPPYPPKELWAHDPNGAHQVGSIFTGQGFEFDYCGVIMGADLVARDNDSPLEVQIHESANTKLVKEARKNPEFLQRFRNGYRVLLTRAKRGVVLYSTDPQTQELLKAIVNPVAAPAPLESSNANA